MNILRLATSSGAIVVALAFAACGGNNATGTTTTGASSSTGTTGHTGGAGTGGAGSGGTATTGTGGVFTVAPHAAQPKVVNLGGPVLTNPKVQLIRYASDPHAVDLDKFLQELKTTAYWADTTSEYGVGPLTILPTIVRPEAAPKNLTDNGLTTELGANTSGATPLWGAADPGTLYLYVMPPGTVINAGGNCCSDFDGYHDEAQLATGSVAYAVVCSCGGAFDGPGVTDLQQITIAMSHEMVEGTTDPFVQTSTAFGQNDNADIIWTLLSGGELADMCEFNVDSFWVPPGSQYMIQTSWSNAAAKAGKDPCVPSPQKGPFFGATAVLPDMLHISGVSAPTKGVKLAKGMSTTIDVQLYSDGPLSGPFTVKAMDSSQLLGGAPNLKLTLDKNTGVNGDTLKLTIQVLAVDPNFGVDAFILLSQLGKGSSLTFSAVGP